MIEPDWYRYLFGTAISIWFVCWVWALFCELWKEYRRSQELEELRAIVARCRQAGIEAELPGREKAETVNAL